MNAADDKVASSLSGTINLASCCLTSSLASFQLTSELSRKGMGEMWRRASADLAPPPPPPLPPRAAPAVVEEGVLAALEADWLPAELRLRLVPSETIFFIYRREGRERLGGCR